MDFGAVLDGEISIRACDTATDILLVQTLNVVFSVIIIIIIMAEMAVV